MYSLSHTHSLSLFTRYRRPSTRLSLRLPFSGTTASFDAAMETPDTSSPRDRLSYIMPIGELVLLLYCFFHSFFVLWSHYPGVAWSSPHTYFVQMYICYTHICTCTRDAVLLNRCASLSLLNMTCLTCLLHLTRKIHLHPKIRPVFRSPSLAQPFPLVRRAAPSVGPSRSTYIERSKTAYPPTLLIGSLAETDAPTTHLGVKLFSLFTFSLSWFARSDPPPPPCLFYLLFVSFVRHPTLLCLSSSLLT